ncbi:hypothetical protein [Streptomyces sp. PsTaAH-124]|uniref:hypothetical protein n=1 Tax=Streptomyces sp. PsTaAH-124 TaxID=1157638 RepID=UPI0003663256|nr:hypothetical protein [Streptomyces sp. PsTaAH-124]
MPDEVLRAAAGDRTAAGQEALVLCLVHVKAANVPLIMANRLGRRRYGWPCWSFGLLAGSAVRPASRRRYAFWRHAASQ